MKRMLTIGLALIGTLSALGAKSFVDTTSEGLPRLNDPAYDQLDAGKLEGEYIDPRTGKIYWEVTETVLPGNGGLDIVIGRSFGKDYRVAQYSIGNWELEIPRILINVSPSGASKGGSHGIAGRPNGAGLCLDPESYNFLNHNFVIAGHVYFSGIQLNLPGTSSKSFAFLKDRKKPVYRNAKYATKDGWIADCISTGRTSGYKDAFLVTSPDGTKYTFDVIGRQLGDMVGGAYAGLTRVYVSKIEDTYGNTLTFSYDQWIGVQGNKYVARHEHPYLKRITASDGRIVDFNFSGTRPLLRSFNIGDRSWSYKYSGRKLVEAIGPENKIYKYEYGGPKIGAIFADNHKLYPEISFNYLTKQTQPTGVAVEYSYSKYEARFFGGTESKSDYHALRSRTVSGSGIPAYKWNYSYSLESSSNISRTTIAGPIDQKVYRFHRGNWKKSTNFGLLKSYHLYSSDGGSLLRASENKEYRFCQLGFTKGFNESWNAGMIAVPIKRVVDGRYTTRFGGFNDLCMPFVKDESGDDYRIEVTDYYNDKNNWIVNKIKSKFILGDEARPVDLVGGNIVSSIADLDADLDTAVYYRGYNYNDRGKVSFLRDKGVNRYFSYTAEGDVGTQKISGYDNAPVYEYSNYKRGIPQYELQAGGVEVTRVVSDYGAIESESGGKHGDIVFAYDALDRLTGVTPKLGAPAIISWPSFRQRVVERGNYKETLDYDALGRELASKKEDLSSGEIIFSRKEYDARGRAVFSSYPSKVSNETKGVVTNYDELDRVVSTLNTADNSTTSTCYDKFCNVAGVMNGDVFTDPRGYKTYRTYRSYGSPDNKNLMKVKETVRDGSEGKGAELFKVTSLERDNVGRITKITQGQFSRSYFYGGNGFLDYEINPETGKTSYRYDARGNRVLIQVGDLPGTEFRYDSRDRLTDVIYPYMRTGKYTYNLSVAYDYNQFDKVTSIRRGDTLWRYDYDDNLRLVSEVLRIGSLDRNFSIGYKYDSGDHLNSIVYPNGEEIVLSPDAFGRSTKIGSYANSVGYHEDGMVKQFSLANGITTEITKNLSNLPERFLSSLGVLDLTYHYDNNQNILSIVDGENSSNNKALNYDGIGQLTVSDGPWGEGRFAYDGIGNIELKKVGEEEISYSYDDVSNLLSSTVGGERDRSFLYDKLGNIISDGYQFYSYDYSGNLFRVSKKNYIDALSEQTLEYKTIEAENADEIDESIAVEYIYDGNNRRVVEIVDSNVARFNIYSKSGMLVYEEDTFDKGTSTTYYYLGKQLVAKKEQCSNSFCKIENRIGFTGHRHDSKTGLTFMGDRYYDPAIARFLSIDPEGAIDHVESNGIMYNRYAYANNSPYKFEDPNGRAPQPIGLGKFQDPLGLERCSGVCSGAAVMGSVGRGVGRSPEFVKKTIDQALARFYSDQLKRAASQNPTPQVLVNRSKGKLGESITESTLRGNGSYAGKQVTFETSTGRRSVIDFVTRILGGRGVVETKTGKAKLTGGQSQLFDDINNGRPVIPRGKNAKDAGLTPGRPVILKSCSVDRPC